MIKLHSCYARDLDGNWKLKSSIAPYNLLILITSGKLIYWVNNEKFPLQKGDVLYIPEGSLRAGEALEFHQRYAAFFSANGDEKEMLPLLARKKPCALAINNFAYFKQRFSLLNHHWLLKGTYMAMTCHAILLEMLSVVNYDLDHRETRSKKMKLVVELKQYIFNHYREPIKLQDLADHCGKTPNYISYVFKEVTGFSPIDYLHGVRISVAKDLMLSKCLTIREISEYTGFCDQAYFTRIFKKMTGFSPTTFMHEKKERERWAK